MKIDRVFCDILLDIIRFRECGVDDWLVEV